VDILDLLSIELNTSMVVAPDEVAPADGRWWAFTLLVSRLAELPHGALATRQHKKEP
jgi:hypothetical protein